MEPRRLRAGHRASAQNRSEAVSVGDSIRDRPFDRDANALAEYK